MTFLRHYLKTQRLIICVFIGLLPILASGQVVPAPGGISGASLWSSDGDSAGFIGNYHTLNLLDLEVSAAGKIPKMEGATTLFLVLKPSFTSSTGKKFMELGDITVFDNKIMHGATWTSLDFSDGNPKILTLSMQRSSRYKTSYTPHLEIIDSSLFSIAELVYYPRLSSREQVKMVNTYLAIKYSVPITGVSDKDWRDYLAADSSRYWDYTTDKMYSLRVLGLGRSASEDLYQSQTQASPAGDELMNEALFMGIGLGALKAGSLAFNALKGAGGSLWNLPSKGGTATRGFVWEKILAKPGAMKSHNFPVIDFFYKGVATSAKTLDIHAASYSAGNRILGQLMKYVDELASFEGASWGGDQVWSNQINRRVLDVAIPRGATPAQVQQLEKAIELAKNKNVEILIHVVQ